MATLALAVVATRHISGVRNMESQSVGSPKSSTDRDIEWRKRQAMPGPIGREKQQDADAWGVSIPSDEFDAIEGDKFRYTHGRLNTVGQPLAGGGVVGKDDWRTINMNGRPSSTQMRMAERRAEIFYEEFPARDPLADARKSASEGDWKLFIVPIERPYSYAGEGFENPLDFKIVGLEHRFGCKIDETFMRRYGKRPLDDYYDAFSVVAPLNKRGGAVGAFEIIPAPLVRWNYHHEVEALSLMLNYEAIYNRSLYDLLTRRKSPQLDGDHVANALRSLKSPKGNIYNCPPR